VEQVKKITVGVFDGTQLIFETPDNETEENDTVDLCPFPSPHSLDSCSICLDEYVAGDKIRCLSCTHAFHSRCIAKWLIERSATCPLCKTDLYEEEEEEDDDEEEQGRGTGNHQQEQRGIFSSWASVPSEALVPTNTPPAPAIRNRTTDGSWRRRGQSLGAWGRNLFATPGQRRRMAAAQVSESLAEPLLQQQYEERQEHETTSQVPGNVSQNPDVSLQQETTREEESSGPMETVDPA